MWKIMKLNGDYANHGHYNVIWILKIEKWHEKCGNWINCMNMPNVLKMSKLPNCWLIMEFMMIMNLMELIEWLWHDLPLNLISYVELEKIHEMEINCHDRKLREFVVIIIDKWKGNEIVNYNDKGILKMWTWILKLLWEMKLDNNYGKW